MKKIFLLLLTLCIGLPIWAQEKKVTITSHVVDVNDIDDDGFIIQQVKLDEKATASFSLKNIRTEEQEGEAGAGKYPHSFTPEVIMSKDRKKPVASVRIPLYRTVDSKIERLTSYDLEMTTIPLNSSLAARPTDVANSVLKSGNWYKIAVNKRGVYKIDYAFLQSMGITPSTINPANIRIYGNGGTVLPENITGNEVTDLVENSIFVSASGSTFGTGDYILFYANGPVKWGLNSGTNRFVHTPNYYEDNSYYFLNFDIGPGKRVPTETATGTADATLTSFDDYAVIDVDSFNPGTIGKIWWSNKMNSAAASTQTHTFNMNMGQLEGPLTLETVAGATMDAGGSSMKVSVNGSDISTLTFGALVDHQAIDREASSETFNPSSGNLEIKIKFNPVGTGAGYLDYFRFNARRKLSIGGWVAAHPYAARGRRQRLGQRLREPHQAGRRGQHADAADRVVPLARQRSLVGEPERIGQHAGHAGVGDVRVGVTHPEGDAGPDERRHGGALGTGGRDRVHPAQQQRVVRHEQVRAPGTRLVDDRERRVEREEDAAYGLARVTGDQTDAVPVGRVLERVEGLQRRDDVAQPKVSPGFGGWVVHVGPAGLEPTTPAV